MSYTVNSLEEMPNALSYLIKTVEELQSTVKALQHKQASDSPKWMDIDELCAYLPSHPAKQTVYGWECFYGLNQVGQRIRHFLQ